METVRELLDQQINIVEMHEWDHPRKVAIRSSLSPFLALPGYNISYPGVVVRALESLYGEYNAAFGNLVEKNREWDTDYRYCMTGPDDSPVNIAVQIDMLGLPLGFLDYRALCRLEEREEEVREVLRGRIFEIENSLAMYQLLERIFPNDAMGARSYSCNGKDSSFFKDRFRASLDEVRQKHHMPIALLAVTDEKYAAMKESEFGRKSKERLSDAEVKDLSGFDRFFGPEGFREYVAQQRGECHYLLYARTSDPVAKLKNPDMRVEHSLLSDPDMRWLIKAHALTFNIDAPEMGYCERINDTKEYMRCMGMGFQADAFSDIITSGLTDHMARGRAYGEYPHERLCPGFVRYMAAQGYDAADVESGEVALRAKPMKGAYGCYGHMSGQLSNMKFRNGLRSNMRKRGSYVIQPEMRMPVIVNKTDGQAYTYIDRNFFACTGERPRFLGGFRSLMSIDSVEAKKGRIHGNGSTVYAEIIASAP